MSNVVESQNNTARAERITALAETIRGVLTDEELFSALDAKRAYQARSVIANALIAIQDGGLDALEAGALMARRMVEMMP